jgi:hypothetical protein
MERKKNELAATGPRVEAVRAVVSSDEWTDEMEARIRDNQPGVLRRSLKKILKGCIDPAQKTGAAVNDDGSDPKPPNGIAMM